MKRNLFLLAAIFLGVVALMFIGDVITIGEKLAHVTNTWYAELVFYGIIVLVFFYLVVFPLWRIHASPEIPGLSHEGCASVAELKKFGYKLADNCSYIPDLEKRKEHRNRLREQLERWDDEKNILAILDNELSLRLEGDKAIGVRGLHTIVRQWAQTVFMVTAMSPNSKLDAFSTLVLNHSMIKEMVYAAGFRPTTRQLIRLYWHIFATAVLSFCVSEALANVGSVHPFSMFGGTVDAFDKGDVPGVGSDPGTIDEIDLASDMEAGTDAGGGITAEDIDPSDSAFSLSSIIRKFHIPGFIIGPFIDGTMNALMTLRIGYVTKAYLVNGSKAFAADSALRREIKRTAVADSVKSLPVVVIHGCKGVSKGFYKAAKYVFSSSLWQKYEKRNADRA